MVDIVRMQLQKDQDIGVKKEALKCKALTSNFTESLLANANSVQCPPIFDTITCWPATAANTTATLKCPEFVIGFVKTQNATKVCESDGSWNNWTNFQSCVLGNTTEVPIDMNKTHSLDNLKAYVPTINIISRTGYSISFFTLILAFLIMFSIKKLHCARNKLHMHLFASFIMRAGMRLLKDLLFTDGIGLNSHTKLLGEDEYMIVDVNSSNWGCKLFTSLFNFFITANYSWILMEGLYLYNLIFRSMFADSNMKITQYIILGWGMPFIVVGAWTTMRILTEDTFCWTTHDHDKMTFWIIRIPTAVSILLNLYLFVRIALVIYMKLQSPNQEAARSYKKWARSTLVLAPLFGIHYAVLIGMSSSSNETVETIWLFADQLFASFNGFVVAILYCFLNSEVRTELKPHVHAVLVFVASHNCLKYLFPCRERYLRSARGRTSVCTTMSCSSLFNNVVNPRHSRAGLRGDQALRNKNDRNKDHITHPNARYIQDDYQARNSRGTTKQLLANGAIQQNERLGCLGEDPETFCMLPPAGVHHQQPKIETPD